jgi:hypothetical protein
MNRFCKFHVAPRSKCFLTNVFLWVPINALFNSEDIGNKAVNQIA